MALRSGGRNLSYEILSGSTSLEEDDILLLRSNSDPFNQINGESKSKRRKRRSKKKKALTLTMDASSIQENPIVELDTDATVVDDSEKNTFFGNDVRENGLESNLDRFRVHQSVTVCEEAAVMVEESVGSVCTSVRPVMDSEFRKSFGSSDSLRQRGVSGGGSFEDLASSRCDLSGAELSSLGKQRLEPNGNVMPKLDTAESLDWKRFMAKDPQYLFPVEQSPVKYFLDEMYNGNSLRSTTTLGNDKERESVYDTLFRLPWRCELLINVGFFVCFDSFLSLLTIMPTRILMTLWKLVSTRQFKKPSAAELSDLGCLIVLACGVALLQRTDISLIYHMIRGQGTIKLYVVYNVLEIFDKLCQSFGGDVLQTLFSSAEGLASSSPETMRFWLWRFISDQLLAVVASIVHSFILLAQAITLSTCIVAHNNALFALLISNNFAEIKSNVFKRFSKDNIHSMVYYDSVERFHISAFILFVLAQNILEAEGPWFENFLFNALLVYICEMVVDILKHSFIAKFNEIKPITYSGFLEDLCKQTLNIETEHVKKNLTFVPLAPACVVIRVLTPVYAAHLPHNPIPWRLFWIFLLSAMTYVMLASLKVMIGMVLQKFATWYIDRCRKRKHHLHSD